MNKHEFFMDMALDLAKRGLGTTNPNPMVGAVVVRNGRVVTKAYHRRAGALHAEALALRMAGKHAKGGTLYVNLEPCAHLGRTPPCTGAIIKSKIKKVFCAMKDPNPLNNGRGIATLRKNNIAVSVGLLQEEAQRLNEVFVKYITEKIPFVTLKMAASLDGKIATRKKDSKWISSEISRGYVHRLRRDVDAILVGVNTIIEDNPVLTSRQRRSPIKVVLDPDLKVPEGAKIFSKESPRLSIVAIQKKTLRKKGIVEKVKRLNKKGVLVISCAGKAGKINLKMLLKELAELEIAHLLVEGGGETAASFLEEGLVDRVLFFIAPKIIGGKDAISAVGGIGVDRVDKAIRLRHAEVARIGEDILIKGYVYRNS
jgi:diaminohydroxyphosphoribosylaminopyrimidine deaminase/5-amino-6-(5-phosphoribosylamino)uracil reductase